VRARDVGHMPGDTGGNCTDKEEEEEEEEGVFNRKTPRHL